MYEPEVCYHLNHLGISPLKTAFPWIVFMFVGVLEVDQVSILFAELKFNFFLQTVDLLTLG
jgi:hypothetical protein